MTAFARLFLRVVCAASLAVLAGLTPVRAQDGGPLPLGAGDRVRLKVFGQPDLSDVFEIGRGGSLIMPGLGTLSGLSDLDQARARVGELIDRKIGLAETSFSLTVEAFRPVIVGGSVARPGEVAFKPGLRVVHAIALAGGQGRRSSEDLSIEIQINQEEERLAAAKGKLARARLKEMRLTAELKGSPLGDDTPEIAALIGPAQADAIYATEKQLYTARAENRKLALRRVDASTQINSEDIAAQQSVSTSLTSQLDLVRKDLARLEPLFVEGAITASRILELRRDYVEIEGQVGQAVASLAQARTRQVVLSEEGTALDLQLRLELLGEITGVQFEIIEAQAAIDTITRSLDVAGVEPAGVAGGADSGPCQFTILREDGAEKPATLAADQLTPLKPGDLLFVSRSNRNCPSLAATDGSPQ